MAASLPAELIEEIGKRLNTKSDISRFRAVCRSWRSSIPAVNSKLQTFNINIWAENLTQKYAILHVNETAVYHHLVSPAFNEEVQRNCLVKLRRPDQGDQVMNLLDFQEFELAKAYNFTADWGSLRKLVTSTNLDDVMLLFVGWLYHGKSGRDKHGYMNLYRVHDDNYADVIFYQGMFYTVNWYGRAVAVDSSLNLTTVAFGFPTSSSFGYHVRVQTLVESSGDLLLVRQPGFVRTPFQVYKLNTVEKKWVEMKAKDLSDRILVVLGHDRCAFSVAAKDFPGCQGSCIYFSNRYDSEIRVFDLRSGILSADLRSLPHSASIFLPRRDKGSDSALKSGLQSSLFEKQHNL